MSVSYDIVVIGAGITGAATAYHLLNEGAGKVLLVERGEVASGGTGKSAAIVRQHYSTKLMTRLALASLKMFEAMEESIGVRGGFNQTGWLMLVPDQLAETADANLVWQRALGVETNWVPEAEWDQRFPWLNPEGVKGIIHEPRAGHADPVRVTEGYVEAVRRAGGEVRLRTPCRGLLRSKDRIEGILLDDGPVRCGTVVNAAGPWARHLAETAAIDLPLRAVREQDSVWQLRRGHPAPGLPISNAVDAIYSVPQGTDAMLIGQGFPKEYFDVDPYNYKETADEEFISLILERSCRRMPSLEGMRLLSGYGALYDVSPDWYPIVGPRAGLTGYADASGGSGHGFKVGPAIGRELARWIAAGEVGEDFADLSYDRIPAGRLFVGSYGGNRG